MSTFLNSPNDSEIFNEKNLPVELQTKNVISPAYNVSDIPATNGPAKTSRNMNYNGCMPAEPYVEIIEQPQQRGFRFRYECEGPSHGGLQGTKSERSRKSYPAIKIWNYEGAARVVVSLVTDEKTPRCHAHKLVGNNCKNGLCTVEIKANTEPISFANLSILHVTRKKLTDVLMERILDSIKLNKKLKVNNMNFDPPLTEEDMRSAKQQAVEQSKNMLLNAVKLCFQVFLRNADGTFSTMLNPVFSQPIYDSKSPGASALKICRMDKYGGCCSGNEEVFLLCEKVQKDDIQVRFVEQNSDGSVKWEAYGNFGPLDVHRQYAIVFKTPAYWNVNIDKAVNVLIMLQRKSDQEVSEPKAFTYFPQNRDKDNIQSKKRKRIPLDGYDFGGDGSLGSCLGGEGGSGLDRTGSTNSGGNIMGNPGGNGANNIMVTLQNGVRVYQQTTLPRSVEEAVIKAESESSQDMLDSSRLLASLTTWSSSSDHDPWLSDDLDIEVDAAIMPSFPTLDIIEEDPDDPLVPKGAFTSPQHRHQKYPVTRLNDKNDKKAETKNLISESSLDWLDSGVVPDSGKSLTSLDERKVSFAPNYGQKVSVTSLDEKKMSVASLDEKKMSVTSLDRKGSNTSLDIAQQQKLGYTLNGKEEKYGTKAYRTLLPFDIHKEQDGKVEVSSEGVKSDEGFSEASEDLALKGQLLSPEKLKSIIKNSSSKSNPDASSSHCSNLTDTVRKVTGRVAERTVAALTDFAETGDIRHLLLVQRHLMAVSNKNGDLPLHLAVINSQPGALKSLLDVMCTLPESGRLVNSQNYLRQTALHLASVMKQDQMVEMLLHAGADPSIADRNGNTAAHLAVINSSSSCLKALVKYLRPGQRQGNPFPELNYLNYDGYSPVHLAALAGSVDMLRTLVFGRADVELPDGKSGKTALHHAVDNDDLPIASYLLLEARADVNARCFDGNTALHIACARQLVGMVALLMTAGADIECENEEIPDPEAEEGERVYKRGMKPVDYVDDNEQILKILYGETNGEPNTFSNDQGDCDDLSIRMAHLPIGNASIHFQGYSRMMGKSGLDIESTQHIADHEDMSYVCNKTRIELSRQLDYATPGQDVLALAVKLGYPDLVGTLENIRCSNTSPTTFLLEYFESDEGSISRLRDALLAIGREDVAALVFQSALD